MGISMEKMADRAKYLVNRVLLVFGYRITKARQYTASPTGDIIANQSLLEARAFVSGNCPDPHYNASYRPHEIGAWGPIPVLLYLLSRSQPKATDNPKVLDIGCAYGTLLSYCSNLGFRSYGIDLVPLERHLGAKTEEKYHINYHHLSIEEESLPFRDGEFDVVIMTEVLEHFHFQPLDVLSKVYGVLKKDGLLLLTTPALGTTWPPKAYDCPFEEIPSLSEEHKGYKFSDKHMKIYDREELSRLLDRAGFSPFVGLHVSPNTGMEHLYAIATKK